MRFQSAFIAVSVLAAPMVMAEDILDESKAIEKIELLGGTVTRDETLPGNPVVGIDFQGSERLNEYFEFNEGHVQLLGTFPELESLELIGVKFTDDNSAATVWERRR